MERIARICICATTACDASPIGAAYQWELRGVRLCRVNDDRYRANELRDRRQCSGTYGPPNCAQTIRVAHAHEQADDGRGRLDIGPLNESTAIQKEASRG